MPLNNDQKAQANLIKEKAISIHNKLAQDGDLSFLDAVAFTAHTLYILAVVSNNKLIHDFANRLVVTLASDTESFNFPLKPYVLQHLDQSNRESGANVESIDGETERSDSSIQEQKAEPYSL